MWTNTYTYVRYNIYQTVYKQTHMLKQKGNSNLGYLANKQHFVPFHPIKALDRPKHKQCSPRSQQYARKPDTCHMPQSLPTITARHALKDAILKQELKKVAKAA